MNIDYKNIDFNDSLINYKSFIENIYSAHSYLYDLILSIRKFLENYCRLRNVEEDFVSELVLKLAYFESYYQILDSIVDELDKYSLTDSRKKEEEYNFDNSNVCLFYPKYYYEQDIYVPKGYKINWDDLR